MKKIKLFLSHCMLCLCVAVLCMGILAAGSATYQINGNISYNMIDGVARVNARVYKVAGTGTLTSDQLTSGYITTLATMELEDISKSTSPNYILTETKDTIAISENGGTASFTADIVYGANTDQSTYYTYFIVLNITNQSSDTGYVLNAYLSTLGTSSISNIASNANGSSNTLEIKSGKFTNIVIGLSYAGNSTTSEKFNYTLNVSYEEKNYAFADVELKQDTTNSYWYVELGQVSSTYEAKLKWRYVGDYSTSSDGTETFTRYTSTTRPEIGSGSVFVQQTNLLNDENEYVNDFFLIDTFKVYEGPDYFTYFKKRSSFNDGSMFNLDDKEKSLISDGIIGARNLPNSGTLWYTENDIYPCTYTPPSEYSTEGNGGDVFWLLSICELFQYFGDYSGSEYEFTYDSSNPLYSADFCWDWSDPFDKSYYSNGAYILRTSAKAKRSNDSDYYGYAAFGTDGTLRVANGLDGIRYFQFRAAFELA